MFQQVTIWLPTPQLIIEIVTAYYLIGFVPWIAWCISETWCDHGRNSRTLKLKEVFRLLTAWSLWPVSIDVTKRNLSTQRFNRDYRYYQ